MPATHGAFVGLVPGFRQHAVGLCMSGVRLAE
jgi:hypothetical protein